MTQSELETATPNASRPERLNLWLNIALGVLLAALVGGGAYFGYTIYQDRVMQDSSSATGRLVTLLTAQIRKSPNDEVLRVRLGEAYGALNKYPQAIEQFNAALKINPKHSGALLDLGMVAMLTNNNGVAQNYFQKVLSVTDGAEYSGLNTEREQALYNLGTIALGEKRYSDAAGFFKGALAIRRDASDTYYQLARSLEGLGAIDDAISQLEIAVQFDPGFAEAHYLLGELYKKKKDDVNASYQLVQAVKLAPGADTPQQALDAYGPASDWVAKASAALAKGDIETALENVLVARNLDGNSVDAAKLHGKILIQRGDITGALAVYKEAVAISPKDAEATAQVAALTKRVAAMTPAQKAADKKAAQAAQSAAATSTTSP